MRSLARGISVPLLFIVLMLVTGCAVRLLPNYDESIYQRLVALNETTELYFNSVATGASAASFNKFADTYDVMIAGFDSMLVVMKGREIPEQGRNLFSGKAGRQVCPADITVADCLNPTPKDLTDIIAILKMLRERHRTQGLEVEVLTGDVGLKRVYEGHMIDILKFESALNR